MNDGLEEDEQQTDEPEIDCLARMPDPQEVENAKQNRHGGEVG